VFTPPDWRDAAAYKADRTPLHWAWEFLRRNPDYQAYHETHREEIARIGGKLLPADVCDAFGLDPHSALPDPECDQPRVLLPCGPTPCPHLIRYLRFRGSVTRCVTEGDSLLAGAGEAVYRFDLTQPIDRQLERARDHLLSLQRARETQPKARSRSASFPSYLQVLDGEASGASIAGMASHILSADGSAKTIASRLRYARAYLHHDYRSIPLLMEYIPPEKLVGRIL